jgi:hypothetical protein
MPITSRSALLSLLTEACELEHGLACSYLFSAFTLKQDLSEGGLTWQHLQMVRAWAAQVFFIAAQEMLHLAQVWNMQAAIGGTPYYMRPNFPQPPKYYPLNLPLRTERFSLAALDRFIQYERPATIILRSESPLSGSPQPAFKTVGELYALIKSGFENIPEETLFVGYPNRQVGADLVDFPELVKVIDRASALEAIRRITHQGEGVDEDRDDCHFGLFKAIRKNYLIELASSEGNGEPFAPVRLSISNPVAGASLQLGAHGANPITDTRTSEVADCFDSIYGLMLRMLQYVFDNATGDAALLRQFGKRAIELMAAVIKPLGEALTLMPAGPDYEDQTAGPGFVLSRHVGLPNEPRAAAVVALEKLQELSDRLRIASEGEPTPRQLRSASANLDRLGASFREYVQKRPS